MQTSIAPLFLMLLYYFMRCLFTTDNNNIKKLNTEEWDNFEEQMCDNSDKLMEEDLKQKLNEHETHVNEKLKKEILSSIPESFDDLEKIDYREFQLEFVALNKDSLLKHISEEDYLTLIGTIDDISHLFSSPTTTSLSVPSSLQVISVTRSSPLSSSTHVSDGLT